MQRGPGPALSLRLTSEVGMNEPWDTQMQALGAFIRSKRQLANMSL